MKTKFFLLLLLINGLVRAQSSISGRVSDADTKEAVPFANVVVSNTTTGTTTDETGQFKLQLPAGKTSIIISSIGYKSDTLVLSKGKAVFDVALRPSGGKLSEVVVSGTMRAMSKMESPIPVEVYTAALFKKNPTPSLFESMNMITGVQPQLNCNVCNTGDIHINGLEGPYTMILIDGMPIVSALSSVYGLHGIPGSMVKRVEVVKGPASTLYGSEAVAGLVNVITRDAISSPLFKADISGTTVGEFNADVSAKWKAGRANSLLGVNYFNYWIPKDINKDNFTDVTQQNRFSIFNKWDIRQKNDKAASLAWRYVYENRWGGEMQWNTSWRGTDSVYGESIYTHRVEAFGLVGLPTGKENIRLDYSYNYHFQDSYYGKVKYLAQQHTAFAQLVWDKEWKVVSLLSGLPFRFMYYDDNSVATIQGDSANRKNKPSFSYLPGVFAQAEFRIHPKFTMLTGARYDYNSAHGHIFTPRLSFKFSPHKNHTLRLTGGSGYRVVNIFTEDHAALTGAREVVISSALKPERSWNGNLNYNGYINHAYGFVDLDVSLFYTYFTNQIVADFLSDPQKIIYDNLNGYATSRGASTTLNFSFTNGLHISTGFTWMDVFRKQRDTKGVMQHLPQLFAPQFSANYTVSYNIRKIGLTIDWTGRINGPMHLPVVPNDYRPEKSPTYCLMSIQLTKILPRNFEIYAGIKNALNFLPKDPILRAFDPFDKHITENNPNNYTFDPSYNYAPIQGIKGFIGLRWTLFSATAKQVAGE